MLEAAKLHLVVIWADHVCTITKIDISGVPHEFSLFLGNSLNFSASYYSIAL